MSKAKPFFYALMILIVAAATYVAGKLSIKPDPGLWDVDVALRAAEELDYVSNPEVRKALEHIATTHLILSAQLQPPVEAMVGAELEGLCRAIRYFHPMHQSASLRDPAMNQSLSVLVRPYLQQVTVPIRERVTSRKFSQVMTPQCAEVFDIKGQIPCILESGCPE